MRPPDRGSSTLTFLGGAGGVTGSKFLLETRNGAATPVSRVLVDAGLFQGERAWRRLNWQPPPVDPARIDAVVITHAHLDHCGYLPVLVRNGFTGPVWCTEGTARLAEIVLRDAGHLQEMEASDARRYSKHDPPLPLFTEDDAARAVATLRPIEYDAEVPVAADVTARLHPAGHILGSAFAEIDAAGSRVLVSGDLGRPDHELLRPPPAPREADTVLLESTYGDTRHPPAEESKLAEVISRTARRGGACLMPTFAVDRTPVVVRTLVRLTEEQCIPHVPIYVDSPMALHAWEVYREAARTGDAQLRPDIEPDDLEWGGHVVPVPDAEQSRLLNEPDHPCVIVSASGMASGGRVLHHLRAQLPDSRNSVVLTGFQVPGTRGRQLADGAVHVKIHGFYVPVRAEVCVIQGLSAHADGPQAVEWLAGMTEPEVVYLVHGEPDAARASAARVRDRLGWTAVVPGHGERVRLR